MKRRCLLFVIVLTVGVAVLVMGQALPETAPGDVGLSAERLERIDNLMKSAIEKKELAGTVSLVVRHGKVAYFKSHGMMDENKPMRNDALFRIASMTKAITTTAVMMLYEEGHFMLNDPVSKYIPEFKNPTVISEAPATSDKTYRIVPAKGEITIRQLLNHTSGLIYRFTGIKPLADLYVEVGISDGLSQTEGTIGDMVKKLAKLPLLFNPGERYQYSLSIDVLGYFVEIISGMPLDKFFEERIFKPLKMTDSYFFVPDEKLDRLTAVYMPNGGGGIEKLPEKLMGDKYNIYSSTYQYKSARTYFSGGAGLVSTAMDYARFLQMTLNGGELEGVRILGKKTVEFMTTAPADDVTLYSKGGEAKFGIGFGIKSAHTNRSELSSVGTYVWGGYFHTNYWADPKEGLIGLFMSQLYPNNHMDIIGKFKVAVYQAIVE